MGEGKAEALMREEKLGANREGVMIGGLWNKVGEVWMRRVAVEGGR